MKLFRVQFDGQDEYVEAETMSEALVLWDIAGRKADPHWDEPDTPQPDGCEMVSESKVIRRWLAI